MNVIDTVESTPTHPNEIHRFFLLISGGGAMPETVKQ